MRCAWWPPRACRSPVRSSPRRAGAGWRSSATSSCSRAPPPRRSSASPAPTARAPSRRSLARMAQRAGLKVRVGGNLGAPALELLDASAELYVLELSSYQLETDAHASHCRAATVLNVSARSPRPLRLARQLRGGQGAHLRALRHRGHQPRRSAGRGDAARGARARSASRCAPASAPTTRSPCTRREWWLMHAADAAAAGGGSSRSRGLHNAANALAALALGEALALPLRGDARRAHRASRACRTARSGSADVSGVSYIDDSKGTNVGATLAAVAGMPGPLVMIAGGDGKNQDFSAARGGVPRQGAPRGAHRARCAAPRRGARRGVHARDLRDAAAGGAGRGARGAARATRCCCRRRARASTCSATTRIAARSSPQAVRELAA